MGHLVWASKNMMPSYVFQELSEDKGLADSVLLFPSKGFRETGGQDFWSFYASMVSWEPWAQRLSSSLMEDTGQVAWSSCASIAFLGNTIPGILSPKRLQKFKRASKRQGLVSFIFVLLKSCSGSGCCSFTSG